MGNYYIGLGIALVGLGVALFGYFLAGAVRYAADRIGYVLLALVEEWHYRTRVAAGFVRRKEPAPPAEPEAMRTVRAWLDEKGGGMPPEELEHILASAEIYLGLREVTPDRRFTAAATLREYGVPIPGLTKEL